MSFHYYTKLPLEQRQQILDDAIKDFYSVKLSLARSWIPFAHVLEPRHPVLAPFACVDREWRAGIEKQLFRNIYLHECPTCDIWRHSELESFDALVVGARRSYLSTVAIEFSLCRRDLSPRLPRKTPVIARARSETTGSTWWREGRLFCVIHQLLSVLKQWDPNEVRSHPLRVKFKLMVPFEANFEAGTSNLWSSGVARSIPAVPFIDAYFTSEDEFSLVKPSTLRDIYNAIPNLRRIKFVQDDFEDDGWSPSHFLDFIDNLKNVSSGLKRLDIVRRSGYEYLPKELAASLYRLTSDLESVVLRRFVDPIFFFERYGSHHFSAATHVVPFWQSLRKHEVVGPGEWLTPSRLRRKLERLLISTGRAIAFMPSIELLIAITGFKYGLRGDREDVALKFERTPGRLDQAGNPDACCLSVWTHLPSRNAVDIWKDSVHQRHQAFLDVRVNLDLDEGWLSWEDAMKEQALESLKDLDEYFSGA